MSAAFEQFEQSPMQVDITAEAINFASYLPGYDARPALDRFPAAVGRLATKMGAVREALPPKGTRIDAALWSLHERGILYVGERVFRTDPEGNPVSFLYAKFRTMPRQTTEEQERVNEMIQNGTYIKGEHDVRTPIGSFMESTSIDELPTLLNVFRRDTAPGASRYQRQMAVFGTHRPFVLACYKSDYMRQAFEAEGYSVEEGMSKGRAAFLAITILDGLRVLNDQTDYNKLARGVLTPKAVRPTRRKVLRGAFSKEFRGNTGSKLRSRAD